MGGRGKTALALKEKGSTEDSEELSAGHRLVHTYNALADSLIYLSLVPLAHVAYSCKQINRITPILHAYG